MAVTTADVSKPPRRQPVTAEERLAGAVDLPRCVTEGCGATVSRRGKRCRSCARHARIAAQQNRALAALMLAAQEHDDLVNTALASKEIRPAVRLRAELTRDRDRYGLPFDEVFAEDVALVVRDFTAAEQAAWRLIFAETREVWRSAFDRTASPLTHLQLEGMFADEPGSAAYVTVVG